MIQILDTEKNLSKTEEINQVNRDCDELDTKKSDRIAIKVLKKIGFTILAIYLGIWLPRYASLLTNALFTFGTHAWDFTHHLFQMVFALIVIFVFSFILKKPVKEWGFNFKNAKWSLTVFWKFCIGWVIFLTIGTIINQLLLGWPDILWFELNWKDFGLTLLFSSTMPGISEEILFRAMVMGILSHVWSVGFNIGKLRISVSNLIAAIIFTIAHIYFTLVPFAIVSFEPMQLVFAFFLGLFYGIMLEKSESLLGPILAHNWSDGIAVVIYTLITIIFMS